MFRVEETDRPFLSPSPFMVTADDVADHILAGAWLVDLREEWSENTDPAAPVGWLRPAGDGFVLLGDSRESVEEWFDLSA